MPFRQPVPRIRIDLLDGSPCSLSPSSTLDIGDILSQVVPPPKLLAESLALDDVDDALCSDGGQLQDVHPFPTGHHPPLFILNSHRTRLPFPIRPEAFELGDLSWDEEGAYPLLAAPTVPRMKLMIREQLYVQKWVDTLTSENPPKHIPWAYDRPTAERKWIAEGSLFPAAVVESSKKSRGANSKEHSCVTDRNGLSILPDPVPYPRVSYAFSEASASIHLSTEPLMSASHTPAKPADVIPDTRGLSKISRATRRTARPSPALRPPPPFPSGSPLRTTSTAPNAPLAARRGKSLSELKLKASVIEELEYPDIPTAFRGSPGVWSPRFDTFPVSFFTDHQSMLMDLKSKSAALGNGFSACIREQLPPQTHSSLSVDEWTFARGLATFDGNVFGLIDNEISRELTVNTGIFLHEDLSTPTKGPSLTARLGFVPRPHSTTILQTPIKHSSDPPGDPLPPRPALISPSTPPNVRGILKKSKSVRFEDAITKESWSSEPAPERPCTPMPTTTPTQPNDPVPGKNIQQRKSAPRSRLPPKPAKGNGRHEPMRHGVGKTPEAFKPTSDERPRQTVHAKENANPAAVPQAQAKQKGTSTVQTDFRRGIEGTAKNRLSTPLRNIFRFR